MRITNTHLYFWGSIFSQWANTPFTENGILFLTAEHYMMYHKALLFKDIDTASKILTNHDPRRAKEFGREITPFDPKLWDKHKLDIVAQGNYLKFTQNPAALDEMKRSKNRILVESSPFDRIWGIGLDERDDRVLDESKWQGQNLLGIALMQARDRILKGQ